MYPSRSVAEAVVTDLMKQAPDVPIYTYYIQDGIALLPHDAVRHDYLRTFATTGAGSPGSPGYCGSGEGDGMVVRGGAFPNKGP